MVDLRIQSPYGHCEELAMEADWQIHSLKVDNGLHWEFYENDAVTEGRAHFSESYRQTVEEFRDQGPPRRALTDSPWNVLMPILEELAPPWLPAARLQYAARAGNTEKMKALLEQNPLEVVGRLVGGFDALYWSLSLGRTEAALLLLSRGVDVSRLYAGPPRRAPLHLAVESALDASATAVVEALIKAGAEVEALTEIGQTPLMLAAASDHDLHDTMRALLQAGADPNRLCTPTSMPVLEHLRAGWSALFAVTMSSAPQRVKKARVQLLKEYGADPQTLPPAQRKLFPW